MHAFPGEVGPTAYASFSAEAGNLIYRNGDEQTTRLTWFDRSGKSLGVVSEPSGYHEPTLSKDDTKVLYGRTDSSGGQDVYMQDLVRGNNMRLTFDPSADSTPVLSPDETQVVFFSNRAGKNGIYRKSSSGAGEDELLMTETIGAYPDSWSSDGKYLLYERVADTRTRVDLWILPMTGEPKPFPYLDGEFEEAHGQFSPDGKWVAYASNQSGRSEVYVRSFPNGSGMWQISNNGGDQPQWRSDGKEIFYMAADRRLTAVPVSGSSTFEVGRPEVLFETAVPQTGITDDRNTYVPSRDGQRFLVNALAESAYLEPLIVILNWGGELKQ